MADVNYSVVDFDNLSAVSDGKTLLYTDGQVCKSENNLSELIQSAVDKQVENKLDTSAFSTVSGNFLTAHQSLDGYATTGELNTASSTLVNKIDYVSGQVDNKLDTTAAVEIYQPKGDYLTANALDEVSGTWNNVSNIKSFTSIAGIEAETSADSLQITNGDNVSITTANKTITISAKDTTYDETNFISASHLENIELASGYAQNWFDNSATIIANGKSGVSALNTITANSSTWTKVTALSEGSNVQISNNNENYTIGVSGVVTSASDSLENKLLVLYNNQWQELNETGAFEVVDLKNDEPDVQNPNPKVIYLTKEEGSSKTDLYKEWIYSNNTWEIIGETSVDLSNYYQKNATSGKEELNTEFNKKLDSSAAETTYAPISLTGTVNTLTGSSATWNEVSAKVDTSSMSSYYTKSETSAASAISDALELKEDKIFVAEYNVTTFDEIKSAYEAGKQIVCRYTNGPDMYVYAHLVDYMTPASMVIFTCYKGIKNLTFRCFLEGENVTNWDLTERESYTKSETSGSTEISAALSGKEDKLSFGYDSSDAIISINSSAIAAGGSNYTAGTDLEIVNDVIGVRTQDCTANSAGYAFAEGGKSNAAGQYSHAEGSATRANGNNSHTEGSGTRANGNNSHAEGEGTSAIGQASHTEGYQTSANGDYSHTEGYQTTAEGQASHAEGSGTSAYGKYSHTEGFKTSAEGNDSHSEGNQTSAIGQGSHTEGSGTSAKGEYSHAEGYSAFAAVNFTHAEGWSTRANGLASHAECSGTSAIGQASHAEGGVTSAVGNASHAEGYQTTANGLASHAEGVGTSANGAASHAEGSGTKAYSDFMHVGGAYNFTTSNALFVLGNGTADNARSDAFIVTSAGVASANDFISNGVSLSGMIDLYNILTARPSSGTYTLKCVNGILSWVEDSNVPANAVGLNNEPVGVNGDYFTVGEGQ